MNNCIRCGAPLPESAAYCPACGKKQQTKKATKRGNGLGTVYRRGRKWVAEITKGYRVDGDRIRRVSVKKSGFATKKEALEYLPVLSGLQKRDKRITWQQLYDLWLPTHRAGASTINCYKAAEKYFADVAYMQLKDVEIDDLQACMDDCPHGKRTRENMKALCGLMYKYAIPRGYADLNLGTYLIVSGETGAAKESFTDEQLLLMRAAIGSVPYVDYIYCMCYLGFRPSELLALDVADYDPVCRTLTGGAKTEAGRNRVVTISPKVLPIVARLAKGRTSGALFCDANGQAYRYDRFRESAFYPALDAIGIQNPIVRGVHKYSPHTCRHTFATLMKRIDAPDKDKMELIGHASPEMLRYYQDVRLADLRRITDVL